MGNRVLKKEEFTYSSVGFTDITDRKFTSLAHSTLALRTLACSACSRSVHPDVARGARSSPSP